MLAALFPPDHPYHWTTIGEIADLQAARLDEVHAFFRRYYHPANASLALAGDIDTGRGARARRARTSATSRPASRVAPVRADGVARRASAASCSRIASSCRGSISPGSRRRCSPRATPTSIWPPTCSPTARRRGCTAGSCSTSASRPTSRPRRTRARSAASCRSRRRRRPATRSAELERAILEEIARLAADGPDRRRDRARPRAGRGAVRVPAADGRRVRRQVRSAERVQRLPATIPATSTATSSATTVVTAASLQQAVGDVSPPARARHAQRRAAGPAGARRARFDAGGRLVMTSASIDRASPSRARRAPFAFPAIEKSTLPNGLRVWTVRHARRAGRRLRAARPARRRRRSAGPGRAWPPLTADMLDEGSGDAIGDRDARGARAPRRAVRHRHRVGRDRGQRSPSLSRFAGPRARRCWPTSSSRPALARGRLRARAAAAAAPADAAARHARRGRRSRVRSGCSTARTRTATRRSAASRRSRP